MTEDTADNSQRLDAAIASARQLMQQGRFAEAQRGLKSVSLEGADDKPQRDLLYMLAVCQRYRKDTDGALATLATLLEHAPEYARAYQEAGHTHLTRNELDAATAAYEQAVHLNPALLASWKALVNLYEVGGEAERAKLAYSEAERLAIMPPELVSVTSLLHEGEFYKAEHLCRSFLSRNKHNLEGMRLLADIGVRLEVFDDAEFLLESCVEFAPEFDLARADYVNVLLRRQKFKKAVEQAKILVDKDADNLGYMSLLASATAGLGDSGDAVRLYDSVLAKSKEQNKIYVMRGHALKACGALEDAIASYKKAYEIEPGYGDAFWSLANTKIYSFTDDEMAHMRAQEASDGVSTDDRAHMCFALGKAYEDRKVFDESFDYYARGNALMHERMRHKAARLASRVDAQIEVCTAALFDRQGGHGFASPDPIFIVGLPRAGSTLLEQILASHSMVDGTLELPNILGLANRLRGRSQQQGTEPGYPKILAEIDHSYFAKFGEQFIEDTRVFRQSAPFFIDKMPNNFFHVGLIRLILPNAKIIDARRHPMSCCFSGFKQLFGEGQEFSYSQADIGNYYRKYVQLMDHWDEVLPGFVLRVQHEDVVDDLEHQVHRMLDFCGLPFEQACLEFHKTERSVRTPSSEQVRQPIYRSGLEQWKNYEQFLGPLRSALGDEILARYPVT